MTRNKIRNTVVSVDGSRQKSAPGGKPSPAQDIDIMKSFEIGTLAHRKFIRDDVFCYLGDLARGSLLPD